LKKVSALIAIFFFFSTAPAKAFNLIDFLFPPIQMQPSTRSVPGPALAPEVPSNDTYSNTLEDNIITCEGVATISKSWEPVQQDTGTTDANGNPIFEYVDYTAQGPITGEMDVENLSNDFYRNYQTFFARGGIKCTPDRAKAAFTNFDTDGTSASLRTTPYSQLLYYRSQFLLEIAQSLDQANPIDTVVQDYQIAWSCGGTCQELTNQSTGNSCRPVYISELLFGLKDEPIYYSSPAASPVTFPSNVLSNVQSHYGGNCSGPYGCYSTRSKGKSFSPLTKDLYELMYSQLNYIPKGNVNSKVTVVNYNCTDANGNPACPVPTSFDRTLPAAAAANANQNLGFINYAGQKTLSNPSLCDNVEKNSEIARDQPVDSSIALIAAFFQRVTAGNSLEKSVDIKVSSTYDAKVVDNTKVAEMAYSNMIPASTLKNNNLLDKSFSSTTTTNQNNPIPDPGYRADALYKEMQSLLRPASWF